MSDTPALLLEAVTDVARRMGESALASYRSALGVETKADGSPVTDADRGAELIARAWIQDRFPHDGILGEEFDEQLGSSGQRWLLDPIDGTKSFIRGVPLWGSMVAVEAYGRVIAGAIYCPAAEELVSAALGEGCWWNGRRTSVSNVSDLSAATILATDASFRHHPERGRRWQALSSRTAVDRTWGDCFGYVLVATGRAELMVDDHLSSWDAAPLLPILQEAGGHFTDWRGVARHDGGDGFASNRALAPTFHRMLFDQPHSEDR